MALPAAYVSADAARAMPDDGNRYEVVWGELLVSPSPRPAHQRLVLRIASALSTYCDALGTVEPMLSPADISWGEDTLVQPDVFVVPRAEAAHGTWDAVRTLLLVIEVLSPGTARHDRFTKRRLYQEQQIPTVWLVDLDAQLVEVWTPTDVRPTLVRETVTWTAPGASEPLRLDLETLLRTD